MRQKIYAPYPIKAEPLWGEPAPQRVSALSDGRSLPGLWWPGQAEKPVILFFHGRANNVFTAGEWIHPLAAAGYPVLVASYRGYGQVGGKQSEAALIEDGRAFIRLARALAPGRRLVLFGYSLGSGPALALTTQENVEGVILLAAFTHLRGAAPTPFRIFVPDAFRNDRRIGAVRVPIVLLQGVCDPIVTPKHATRLYRRIGGESGAADGYKPRSALWFLYGVRHKLPAHILPRIMPPMIAYIEGGGLNAQTLAPLGAMTTDPKAPVAIPACRRHDRLALYARSR